MESTESTDFEQKWNSGVFNRRMAESYPKEVVSAIVPPPSLDPHPQHCARVEKAMLVLGEIVKDQRLRRKVVPGLIQAGLVRRVVDIIKDEEHQWPDEPLVWYPAVRFLVDVLAGKDLSEALIDAMKTDLKASWPKMMRRVWRDDPLHPGTLDSISGARSSLPLGHLFLLVWGEDSIYREIPSDDPSLPVLIREFFHISDRREFSRTARALSGHLVANFGDLYYVPHEEPQFLKDGLQQGLQGISPTQFLQHGILDRLRHPDALVNDWLEPVVTIACVVFGRSSLGLSEYREAMENSREFWSALLSLVHPISLPSQQAHLWKEAIEFADALPQTVWTLMDHAIDPIELLGGEEEDDMMPYEASERTTRLREVWIQEGYVEALEHVVTTLLQTNCDFTVFKISKGLQEILEKSSSSATCDLLRTTLLRPKIYRALLTAAMFEFGTKRRIGKVGTPYAGKTILDKKESASRNRLCDALGSWGQLEKIATESEVCSKAGCSNHAEKRCSNCAALYCSRECQLSDWSAHKLMCGFDMEQVNDSNYVITLPLKWKE